MDYKFPKPFMSITELTKLGLPREFLKILARIKDAPIIMTMGGGKVLFKTYELEAYLKKIEEARNNSITHSRR